MCLLIANAQSLSPLKFACVPESSWSLPAALRQNSNAGSLTPLPDRLPFLDFWVWYSRITFNPHFRKYRHVFSALTFNSMFYFKMVFVLRWEFMYQPEGAGKTAILGSILTVRSGLTFMAPRSVRTAACCCSGNYKTCSAIMIWLAAFA